MLEAPNDSFYDHNSFATPDILVSSGWLEHGPFAMWLVANLHPKVMVELGMHNGYSYFSFAQSVSRNDIATKMYAIDTWKGDEHAGFYDDDIFENVNRVNEANYKSFSTLLRTTFSDGLKYFDEKSIDLLHIDGLHTYEAVKNDFVSWLPKLSDKGIVLFHDISVLDRGFGVYRLWEELVEKHPNCEFSHGNGLGILKVGREPTSVDHLFTMEYLSKVDLQMFYSSLGRQITIKFDLENANNEIAKLKNDLARTLALSANANQQVQHVRQSISWKVTAPLRLVHRLAKLFVKKVAR
jgi:predicted O-methyltransferase YrrM